MRACVCNQTLPSPTLPWNLIAFHAIHIDIHFYTLASSHSHALTLALTRHPLHWPLLGHPLESPAFCSFLLLYLILHRRFCYTLFSLFSPSPSPSFALAYASYSHPTLLAHQFWHSPFLIHYSFPSLSPSSFLTALLFLVSVSFNQSIRLLHHIGDTNTEALLFLPYFFLLFFFLSFSFFFLFLSFTFPNSI